MQRQPDIGSTGNGSKATPATSKTSVPTNWHAAASLTLVANRRVFNSGNDQALFGRFHMGAVGERHGFGEACLQADLLGFDEVPL